MIEELENYVKINGLKAKIHKKLIRNENSAKCFLFVHMKNNYVEGLIFILPYKKALTKEEAAKIANVDKNNVWEADEEESIEITGYKPNYLPPVGIYGVKIFISKELKNKKKLYFVVSEDSTLEIPLEEILSENEQVEFF